MDERVTPTLPTPTLPVLELDTQGATWVAYQDGEGAWQGLALSEAETPAPSALGAVGGKARADDRLDDQIARAPGHIDQRLKDQHLPPGEQRVVETRSRADLTSLAAEDVQTVTIEDAEGRYGVAIVCTDPERGDVEVDVVYYTLREVSSLYAGCTFDDGETPSGYTLKGRVKGVGREEFTTIFADVYNETVDRLEPAYSLELPTDTYDVIAAKYEGASATPNSFILKDVTLNADKTLDLDFSGPDALMADVKTIKVNGAAAKGFLQGEAKLITGNGTRVDVGDVDGEVVGSYAAVPTEAPLEDAFYEVRVSDLTPDDPSDDTLASGTSSAVRRTLTQPDDLTLILPSPFGKADVTVQATKPYVRLGAQWQVYAENDGYNVLYIQQDEVATIHYVFQSPGWLPLSESYSVTLPDLSALEGWRNRWGLQKGVETSWSVYAFSAEGEYGEDGYREVVAERFGTLTP